MDFIRKYGLERSLRRCTALRKKEGTCVCSLERARTVGVFCTFESPETLELLEKSVQKLRENKKTVVTFCYIPKEMKISMENQEGCIFISEKDFNFLGVLKKEILSAIRKQSFDILINTNRKDTLTSLYIAAQIKTKFRIGRCEESKNYCDVAIYSSKERYTMEEYFRSIDEYTKKIANS